MSFPSSRQRILSFSLGSTLIVPVVAAAVACGSDGVSTRATDEGSPGTGGDAGNTMPEASAPVDAAPSPRADGGKDAGGPDAARVSCADGMKNGDETDVDCGGSCTAMCGLGKTCAKAADCMSGQCVAGKCQAGATPVTVGLRTPYMGDERTCALSSEGQVKCWGNNLRGGLGDGTTTHRNLPPTAPIQFGLGRRATSIDLGGGYGCAILDSGAEHCWGDNFFGALGDGSDVSKYAPSATPIYFGAGRSAYALGTGHLHNCTILDDRTLKCWGGNFGGEIGHVGASTLLPTVTLAVGAGRTVLSVSSGSTFSCAILDDKTLKCWGYNDRGQLGVGGTNSSAVPLSVGLGAGRTARLVKLGGSKFACAILDDGTVKCWGANDSGQLGDGTKISKDVPGVPISLGIGRTAVAIAAGFHHACAVLDDATVKCWGDNQYGAVGDGTTTDRVSPTSIGLGAGRTAIAVSAGYSHTCALLDDRTLKCWGGNSYGQLGYGDNLGRTAPPTATVPLTW